VRPDGVKLRRHLLNVYRFYRFIAKWRNPALSARLGIIHVNQRLSVTRQFHQTPAINAGNTTIRKTRGQPQERRKTGRNPSVGYFPWTSRTKLITTIPTKIVWPALRRHAPFLNGRTTASVTGLLTNRLDGRE
jgi:hypothetical protein